ELEGVDVRLILQRLYSIRGTVPADENGHGVGVYAQNLDPETQSGGFSTRMFNNQYEISGVPPGRYAVMGQFAMPPQTKNAEPRYARQMVEVTDRDVEHVDLVFNPAITVKGVVKVADPSLLKNGASINFQETEAQAISYGGGRVSPDGVFSAQLPPGVYRIRVLGISAYLQSLFSGSDAVPDLKVDTAHLSGDLTLVMSA